MGFQTTVVILNDAISGLKTDDGFAERLHSTILQQAVSMTTPLEMRIGNHLNGCLVVEQHHTDHCVPVLVGGGNGWLIEKCFVRWSSADPEMQLLDSLAKKHGFSLVPMQKGKKHG